MNLAVARALTQARKDAGITNEALAAALDGVSLTSVQRYLRGRAAIDVDVLSRICAAIGITELEVMQAAEKLRGENIEDRGADAAVTKLDEHLGRPARTKDEMQQMDAEAAREARSGARRPNVGGLA